MRAPMCGRSRTYGGGTKPAWMFRSVPHVMGFWTALWLPDGILGASGCLGLLTPLSRARMPTHASRRPSSALVPLPGFQCLGNA